MATADQQEFGQISRVKGTLFRWLALGASLFGILALAVLLVYVTVDAFGLVDAEPAWTLFAIATLLGPVLGLWLYSTHDREMARNVGGVLGGGLVGSFLLARSLEIAGYGIPKLDWTLLFLFAVAVPTTGYVLYVGTQEPVGAVGSGLIGRIIAGLALGMVLYSLFVVLDPASWTLIYSLSVLPFVGIAALARRRDSDRLKLLAWPVAVFGFFLAAFLSNILVFYVLDWILQLWAIAIPAALLAGYHYWQKRGRRSGLAVGSAAFLLPTLGSLLAGSQGIPPRHAILVLVPLLILPGLYVLESLEEGRPRLGLAAPIFVCGGVIALVIGEPLLGLAGPNPWLDQGFLTSPTSSTAAEAGLYPAIIGSILIMGLTAVISMVIGVGTAVFLEDYTSDEGLTGSIVRLIQLNIANLAAVPSVVYGLLGLGILINTIGMGKGTVVVASLTLSLLILPITVIAAQEAIRSVPDSLRQGSYAMGATRWQTTKNVVLPEALPGIFTGTILALGRAIGETAPLIFIGIATVRYSPPDGFFSGTTAMPKQVYDWYSLPGAEFQHGVLPAGIVTMLIVLLVMNGAAIVLRNRYERSDT